MLGTIDIIVLLGYTLLILGFGMYHAKRKSLTGFVLGNQSISGFAIGLSLMGTMMSSISFIAFPGKAYAENWNAFLFSFTVVFVGILAAFIFLPIYRKKGWLSAYQILEERFGYWARAYGSISFLMLSLGRVGLITFLLCLPLNQLLGWNMILVIICTGILTTLYTFWGGFSAVVWTDVVQVTVLFGGTLFCVYYLLQDFSLPLSEVVSLAIDKGKLSLGSTSFSWLEASIWVTLLFGLTENMKNFGVDQTYVQRYLAAKSNRSGQKAVIFGTFTFVPIAIVLFTIGTLLFLKYPANVEEGLPKNPDNVFPFFIVNGLPDGMRGLLIAALFAAAMSSLSSSLNSMSVVTQKDLLRRFADVPEYKKLKNLRWLTILYGLLGTIVAISMISIKQALDVWWQMTAIIGGGILGLFLLGITTTISSKRVVISALIISIMVIGWVSFNPYSTTNLRILSGFIGTVVFLVFALIFNGLGFWFNVEKKEAKR